jgi:LacI family transcriptional regulator
MGQPLAKLPRVISSANRSTRPTITVTSPSESASRVKHIALSFPLQLGSWQEIVRGVCRFIEIRTSWVISIHNEDDVTSALAGNPDGIIASVQTAEAAYKLKSWGGHVVSTPSDFEDRNFVQIGFDPLATGKLAAEHLMHLHGRTYVYFGFNDSQRCRLIMQGFSQRLHQAGLAAFENRSEIVWPSRTALPSDRLLPAWLSKLPRPAAVFCNSDLLAHHLARACKAADLRVPQDIAILGCSNDEFLCTVSQPPLSSVGLPFAALGYESAKLLDAHMSNSTVPARNELPPLGVITRQSTDPAALAEPELAAALRFIRDNATNRIGVDDIAAASGMSRSSLERRFRAVVGRSPLAELLRERVDRAQHLLLKTDLAMKEVAVAAGFHDVRHLSVTFRQKAGTSPGKYRAKFRPG